jgi:hypothetical protein
MSPSSSPTPPHQPWSHVHGYLTNICWDGDSCLEGWYPVPKIPSAPPAHPLSFFSKDHLHYFCFQGKLERSLEGEGFHSFRTGLPTPHSLMRGVIFVAKQSQSFTLALWIQWKLSRTSLAWHVTLLSKPHPHTICFFSGPSKCPSWSFAGMTSHIPGDLHKVFLDTVSRTLDSSVTKQQKTELTSVWTAYISSASVSFSEDDWSWNMWHDTVSCWLSVLGRIRKSQQWQGFNPVDEGTGLDTMNRRHILS